MMLTATARAPWEEARRRRGGCCTLRAVVPPLLLLLLMRMQPLISSAKTPQLHSLPLLAALRGVGPQQHLQQQHDLACANVQEGLLGGSLASRWPSCASSWAKGATAS